MGLFRRKAIDGVDGSQVRLLFTSDLHGSEQVFKKFINAGKHFKVDALIIGGDLAGKALVPFIRTQDKMRVNGREVSLNEAEKIKQDLTAKGIYYVEISPEEYQEIMADSRKLEDKFKDAMLRTLRSWAEIADTRLRDTGIKVYFNLGNDDPEYLYDALRESERMLRTEDSVVELGKHEMVSYGVVNPTPWNTPREAEEDTIYNEIMRDINKVSRPESSILNLHAPPHDTNLDNAPKLTEDLRPVIRGGEVEVQHVGSRSVRRVIEEVQPLIGLHGHIHESRGFDSIGKTVVLNPGSEYNQGILHYALIILEKDKVKVHQLLTG